MTEPTPEGESRAERPGRTRTWWHPLLARMLKWALSDAYEIEEEVLVGQMPLRLDVVLLRRRGGELPEAAVHDLPSLTALLNRLTLLEFKSPTDVLKAGDLDQFFALAHLYRAQERQVPLRGDMTLVILAPQITGPFRRDAERSHLVLREQATGVFALDGAFFSTWIVETDRIAGAGEPILTLFSRVFLHDARHIIEQWRALGHDDVLCYVMQQIQQFQHAGEAFGLHHQGEDSMRQTLEELKAAVLAELPVEDRLRGLSPEELLKAVPPEERVKGLPPEERVKGLPPEERVKGLPPEERVKGLPPEDRLHGLSAEDVLKGMSDEERRRLIELAKRLPPQADN